MNRSELPDSRRAPLASRRFLVTGGAQGIGAAIVSRLAAEGATGMVVDLHAPTAETPWPVAPCDVTDERAMQRTIADEVAAHGPFDGLIAAAGIVPAWHSPEELDLDVLDRTMAVNLRGFVVAMKHAAPTMPAGSSIVAIGSLNSWRGDPNLLAYAASKHAVLGAVRSAALALGQRGIRVNAVAPGPVATEALLARIASRARSTGQDQSSALEASAALTALGRLATAEDIADAAVFLSSPRAGAITGQLLPVDGGLL